MQHGYSNSPRPQQAYAQSQEEGSDILEQGRIDAGEKILPPMPEKRQIYRLRLRLIFAFVSLLVLIPICVAIVVSNFGAYRDITRLDVVFAIFMMGSINVIANLLLDRVLRKPNRKKALSHVPLAMIIVVVAPIFYVMMNLNSILLFLFCIVSVMLVFYLTSCEKRRMSTKS